MTAMSTTEARKNLFALVQRVNDDADAITIVGRDGKNAVLVSESEWSAIQETAFLLRSPANARHLAKSMAQADAGEVVVKTMAELHAMADGTVD